MFSVSVRSTVALETKRQDAATLTKTTIARALIDGRFTPRIGTVRDTRRACRLTCVGVDRIEPQPPNRERSSDV